MLAKRHRAELLFPLSKMQHKTRHNSIVMCYYIVKGNAVVKFIRFNKREKVIGSGLYTMLYPYIPGNNSCILVTNLSTSEQGEKSFNSGS